MDLELWEESRAGVWQNLNVGLVPTIGVQFQKRLALVEDLNERMTHSTLDY